VSVTGEKGDIMELADIGAGRVLGYDRRGSGEPLLLIQGMSGHRLVWGEEFLAGLAEDFDVVAYDHRGIGSSTDDGGQFSIADLAADAAALLDALGWDSAHVMGISMGGMVAQELVLAHPERVRTLVLGCTYAGGEGSQLVAAGAMSMVQAMQSRDPDAVTRAAFAANLSPSYTGVEANYAPFAELALAVPVPIPVVMRQVQATATHDTSARLASITAPTLVIHGTADQMLVYLNAELIAKAIPNATLVTFEDVGHLFWLERPAETLAAIRTHALG
jgi:3-oxoadipate enol-lactonase